MGLICFISNTPTAGNLTFRARARAHRALSFTANQTAFTLSSFVYVNPLALNARRRRILLRRRIDSPNRGRARNLPGPDPPPRWQPKLATSQGRHRGRRDLRAGRAARDPRRDRLPRRGALGAQPAGILVYPPRRPQRRARARAQSGRLLFDEVYSRPHRRPRS